MTTGSHVDVARLFILSTRIVTQPRTSIKGILDADQLDVLIVDSIVCRRGILVRFHSGTE